MGPYYDIRNKIIVYITINLNGNTKIQNIQVVQFAAFIFFDRNC